MILTLAGPGAGKTTYMVQQIINQAERLDANREMAIITYTNESVNDLKIKLLKELNLSPNIFIGTIHSFLVNYFIKPYAGYIGFKSNPIMITEKLNDAGLEWIDDWANKKLKNRTNEERRNIIRSMRLKHRTEALITSAQKGIYTYDSIIRFSKQLSEEKEIIAAVCNKIQFLFIDEYQDISLYAHNIVLKLAKKNITQVYAVGDPDQSIYRFRYSNSQIGEKAPQKRKQPIVELIQMDEKQCKKNALLVNHRSSKEIVEFINKYCTLEKQIAENDCVCKIQFISTSDISQIILRFNQKCEAQECENKLILAKKNNTLIPFRELFNDNAEVKQTFLIDSKSLQDYIISASGLNYELFVEKYELTKFDIKKLAVATRRILIKQPDKEILEIVSLVAEKLFGKNILFMNSAYKDKKGMIKYYNYDYTNEWVHNWDENTKVLTIHKSKGLEADGVLVVADSRKQFFKWLNMQRGNMEDEKDEEFRLGYVAYSRAKKVLVLACLEKVNYNELDHNIYEEL